MNGRQSRPLGISIQLTGRTTAKNTAKVAVGKSNSARSSAVAPGGAAAGGRVAGPRAHATSPDGPRPLPPARGPWPPRRHRLPSPAVRARALLVALVLGLLGAAAAGPAGAATAARPPRVTVIGDSVATALEYVPAAERRLGQGLDLHLDTRVCRRLVAPSCPYAGTTPATALEVIRSQGASLGGTVVMDVGYNEAASTYPRDLDTIMRALTAAHVRRVVWVTLREERGTYAATNQVIKGAPGRWKRLSVADWNAGSRGEPWFGGDGLHLTPAGASGLAGFLRPYVLEAVREGRAAAAGTAG